LGCTAADSQTVRFFPDVLANFDVDPTELCVGESIQITNLTEGADDYRWLIDGRTLNSFNPTYTFDRSGVYDIVLIADTLNKCFDTLTYPQPIIVIENPIADFNWQDSLIFDDPDGTIWFENQSQFAERYFWDFGDTLGISEEENPLYRYPYNGYYTVTLTAYNDLDCADTTQQTISPEGFGDIHFPNAFAPNSGAPQDEFTVFQPKGFGITEIDLRVYSIWGDVVWQMTTEDLVDGQPGPGWDGLQNGKLANGDVFLWKLHKICFGQDCDKEVEREGTVTLIR
jgi:PKD repeat protein